MSQVSASYMFVITVAYYQQSVSLSPVFSPTILKVLLFRSVEITPPPEDSIIPAKIPSQVEVTSTEIPWENIQALVPHPLSESGLQDVLQDLCKMAPSLGKIRPDVLDGARNVDGSEVLMNLAETGYVLAAGISNSDLPKELRDIAKEYTNKFPEVQGVPVSSHTHAARPMGRYGNIGKETKLPEAQDSVRIPKNVLATALIRKKLDDLKDELRTQNSIITDHVEKASKKMNEPFQKTTRKIVLAEIDFAEMVSKLWYIHPEVKAALVKYLHYLNVRLPRPRRKSIG
ncbi:hypothetical protein H0H93_010337 [Arthromyces matolae]|nr:hypothetical protein H0H93_010337 [Arthromyces matolae]